MKKIVLYLCCSLAAFAAASLPARAQADVPPPSAATLEQRVADLEAYVNNAQPGVDPSNAKVVWKSNLSSGPGHNAWLLTSTAFVLMMTLPGLALFYGGLVRRKNVLSVLAQCFFCAGMVTIVWWAVGYSFVFGHGKPWLGGTQFAFFHGVDSNPNSDYSYWVSQNLYAMFQLMFAIITPALIVGSIAERMKFSAVMLFLTAWMFVVYFPLAHMVWGIDGLMNGCFNADAKIKAIDFAGGTVVHMSSGWSGLILCLILGKRFGFGKDQMPPHSVVLTMVGTGLLWVGWYGFNAGSAAAADVLAANAFTTTTLATATGSFVWAALEYLIKKKATVVGFCSGAVAGLVVITPACGYVNATGAMWIGLAAGTIPFVAVNYLKPLFGYDDALDTFGVHAIGGTIGAFLTGVLADPAVNANLNTNLKDIIARHALWVEQLKAIGVTLALVVVGTTVLGFAVKFLIGLRAAPEHESQGLDITEHGEEGYIL